MRVNHMDKVNVSSAEAHHSHSGLLNVNREVDGFRQRCNSVVFKINYLWRTFFEAPPRSHTEFNVG